MSDLFHEKIPVSYIARVARVMAAANWHVFQVLTKRHVRMHTLLTGDLNWMAQLPQLWLGVSVEDRQHGLPRLEFLRKTPAATRFLSIEPLLEDLGSVNLSDIDWVIVGGESGAGARPMREEWVLSLLKQCRRAKVPFFFKQWGGVRKGIAGRKLGGKFYDESPAPIRSLSAQEIHVT